MPDMPAPASSTRLHAVFRIAICSAESGHDVAPFQGAGDEPCIPRVSRTRPWANEWHAVGVQSKSLQGMGVGFIALVCAFLGFLAVEAGAAAPRLPSLFSKHMVLQSGVAAPVWGWAAPGESVTIRVAGQSHSVKADATGKWRAMLDPLPAGGPFTLRVSSGGGEVVVEDVLAGEVWIGAGQSNMGFPFKGKQAPFLVVRDYEKEKAAANYPKMRMFMVDTVAVAETPQEHCRGRWVVTKPENIDEFSAILYFFGRQLHRDLGVPVGLIKTAVGGTGIELWIDAAAQRATPSLKGRIEEMDTERRAFDPAAAAATYKAGLAKWEKLDAGAKAAGKKSPPKPRDTTAVTARNLTPGGLYNSKIAPLIPYAIRGVIWSQGESNAMRAGQPAYYREQLKLLVTDWRKKWGAEFPFAWLQISNYDTKLGDWPLVREAMLDNLALPRTGMAVAIDIGEARDVHPPNKQDAGLRLAMWALGDVYGKNVPTSGPLPERWEIAGGEMRIDFKHVYDGLVARGGGPLRGFVIAGADMKWHAADARIEGTRVVVSSPAVAEPRAVRYAWAANPDCNLYNSAGLPASPFRTDRGEAGWGQEHCCPYIHPKTKS